MKRVRSPERYAGIDFLSRNGCMSIEKMAARVASDGLVKELTRTVGLHERLSSVLEALTEAVQNNVDLVESDGADQAVVELMQEQASLVAKAVQSVLARVDQIDEELAGGLPGA
jgi:hypothetical protein